MVAGPDGNTWFTETGKVGRLNAQGTIAEFAFPAGTVPGQLAAGPDGNVWTTIQGANDASLVRITTDGTLTRFPLPAVPDGLTAGPDGNIWYTEPGFGTPPQIARFLVP